MTTPVAACIRRRKSVRAFTDQPVAKDILTRVLDTARHAPSGANTQPWQVAVLAGRKKAQLQELMEKSFRAGNKGEKDYDYYPQDWQPPYKGRRTSCGKQLYDALGIDRQDRERRMDQWIANYRAFDAPVMLLFFIDKSLATGSYLDYGMFLQSLMLAAEEEGLATCPQAALAEYPQLVREFLHYPENCLLLCGMSLGYEDKQAPVNSYRTPREEVTSFTRFFLDD
ncbi:nitroreductase [Desulfopila sp. IMCC35008]|uniref:nitroreductase n=1 Tax=Desulfopila sp. IMCC35008 TaxID=2653858 RepID=UPI0013D278DE|nr:nitroreductase [Desulfopila sp. IMCC35008]